MIDPSLRTRDETPELGATSGPAPPLPGGAVPLLSASGPRYKLREQIARGGMGVVYRAMDEMLGREVAVKVLQEKFTPDSGMARRFEDEARIAGQLQHPGIPPVHDLGNLPGGQPFLAMKLIRGQTLDELLLARPDPSSGRGRFVAVFEQVCQALAYAHAHQVIHRDLKPANVMVGAFAEVQVMDWGLAKVLTSRDREGAEADPQATASGTAVVSLRDSDGSFTQAGSVLGTPAFMPPEQAVGAIGKVDARSDVFGLGAILAVILTGEPPFSADSVETTRVKSAQGDVADCFARLDGCGAEPELVALCKRCLSPRPADRPADAGEVAKSVAALRAAADERARQAELERVRLQGEQATAATRAAERRKRRRLAMAAAAVLAVAVVGGLSAVLVVQRRANAELADEQAKVQARFELAQKAIATFHTGVTEDVLLKTEQFKELRNKLLTEAAGFYSDLEKLLEGQSDVKSRQLLAAGYFQLGALTANIGSKPEALKVHRQALAVRRELASVAGAGVQTRLDVARSLNAVGYLLEAMGDKAAALAAYEEQRDISAALAAESPTDPVNAVLGQSHDSMAWLLSETGKPAEALAAYEKALVIRQKLADAHPTVTLFQAELAASHNKSAWLLAQTGKPAQALAGYRKALAIRKKLAEANPTGTMFQIDHAWSHQGIGLLLSQTGKPAEALAAYQEGLAIRKKLAEANPAVTMFQSDLAWSHHNLGMLLAEMGKRDDSLAAYQQAVAIREKLADAHPTVTLFQSNLAWSYNNLANLLSATGKPADALAMHQKALAIRRKLADANPTVPDYQRELAASYHNIANLLSQTGKLAEALTACEKSVSMLRKLVDANPTVTEYQRSLALSYNRIGYLLSRMGKLVEALAMHHKALAIRQRLADVNRTVTQFQSDLAWSHTNIGNLLSQTGKPAEALAAYQKALAIHEKQADAIPTVAMFQSNLAWSHHRIGYLLVHTEQPAEALTAYQKVLIIRQKLADANPTNAGYQGDLATSHNNLGRLRTRLKQFPEAFAALDRGLALRQKLVNAHPRNDSYSNDLGYSHAYRGGAHVRAGHPALAAADLRRALELWAKNNRPGHEDFFERSRVLALLAGLGADARSGVSAAESAAFADQAVASLRDALTAGWSYPAELKEPDFDAIRDRADCRKLLADRDARTKSAPK
jgi:tetratricopeptide (TPR) repeat protein